MFGKIVVLLLAVFVAIIYAGDTCFDSSLTPCQNILDCNAYETCVSETCCTTDPARNCDNLLDNCDANSAKCTQDAFKAVMSKKCPKTCGTCPIAHAGTCADKVGPNGISDCSKDAYLCNNPVYYDLMTQQCPKTCGRC